MYKGRSINKIQNDIILLIFKIYKFGNIRFVGNLIGEIYWNFYDDDFIIVTSLVLRTQSVSAVFCPAVFFNSPSVKQHCEFRGKRTIPVTNVFKRQTLTFHFSTYRRNSFTHYPIKRRSVCNRESTAAIVETTRRPGSSSPTHSWPWANILHQTCIAGLVKHSSPHTGRILDWMAFALRPLANQKQITERCSLWDTFSGNPAISF